MSLKAGALTLAGLFTLAGIASLMVLASWQPYRPIPVNDLAQLIKSGQVSSLEVSGQDVVARTRQEQAFALHLDQSTNLPRLLESFGVTPDQLSAVSYVIGNPPQYGWVAPALETVLPILLLACVGIAVWRRSSGGSHEMFAFGKTRGQIQEPDRPRVTFDDVAGVDDAKQELQEVVEFLKAPQRFTALGARLPRGVLLIGAPGTGKTLLARAVAGEAGVSFFNISGAEFVEMFVGVGASRVRDLFAQARRAAPCIVFIDEIDAVGRRRGGGPGTGHDERDQTLNQLLVEMDGFDSSTGVIVIAATNRPETLDQALLRPGRFDRQVLVAPPDVRGREEVLKVHARGKPVLGVDFGALARSTPGFSGADLANVLNEAAILAARRQSKSIGSDDVEEAVDRVVAGPAARSRIMTESERRLTAYHEAGHAVVARYLDRHDPVHKVTILGRGRAGGYTRFLPAEDQHYQTRSQFTASITSALGGHVAETLVFGEMSTGAGNDLERATALARQMITRFGMSDRLGAVTLDTETGDGRIYSEQTAQLVDREIRRVVDEAYARARSLIVERRAALDCLADALLRWETVQGAELERALTGESLATDQSRVSAVRPFRSATPRPTRQALPTAAISIS
jgi:cell division protease FtsH